MSDRGIIFSAPMVRALLEGRKTQTRRLLNPQPPKELDAGFLLVEGEDRARVTHGRVLLKKPMPYAPGDRLYVREAWGTWGIFDDLAPSKLTGKEGVAYVADYSDPRGEIFGRLRPSIHMPRWASRLWLEVTDVRVQRVAEISEADAGAEGIYETEFYDRAEHKVSAGAPWSVERLAFADLWNSLHTKPGERWEDNPWVCAVTFDVHPGNIDKINHEGAGAANNRSGDIQR